MNPAASLARGAEAVTHTAWAKINLYLHVVARRADGYHELDSLVVFAGVGDRLAFAPDDDLSLEIDGPFGAALSPGDDNLVLRAARALMAACDVRAGARIRLDKQLPVAAGIGGGSADAAATLDGLATLWGIALPPERMARLALDLGADVPVCGFGRPAFVGGIGERIARAPALPSVWLVLVNPGVPLETAKVFRARAGDFSAPARWIDVLGDAPALAARLAACRNDLEPPARTLVPDIAALLDALAGRPGCLLARLSGSGATCFGLFAARAEALDAAAIIAADRPAWWVAPAPLLHGKLDRLD